MFLIYVNELPTISRILKITLYADDTTLIHTPRKKQTKSEISRAINIELNIINDWFRANRLSLNTDKTKFMVFRQPNSACLNIDLKINNVALDRVTDFNFLGLIVNEFLKWQSHINHISMKLGRVIGILRRLKQFVPKRILLMMYNSLFLPHLYYHLILWGDELGRIHLLQKKVVRVIDNTNFLAHTTPIFIKLKLLPLPEIHKVSLLKFYYRFIHNSLPLYFRNLNIRRNCHYHDYNTRFKNQYTIPVHKHHFYSKKAIECKIISLVNSLPLHINNQIDKCSLTTVVKNF